MWRETSAHHQLAHDLGDAAGAHANVRGQATEEDHVGSHIRPFVAQVRRQGLGDQWGQDVRDRLAALVRAEGQTPLLPIDVLQLERRDLLPASTVGHQQMHERAIPRVDPGQARKQLRDFPVAERVGHGAQPVVAHRRNRVHQVGGGPPDLRREP
jgi:hypothetical protein